MADPSETIPVPFLDGTRDSQYSKFERNMDTSFENHCFVVIKQLLTVGTKMLSVAFVLNSWDGTPKGMFTLVSYDG